MLTVLVFLIERHEDELRPRHAVNFPSLVEAWHAYSLLDWTPTEVRIRFCDRNGTTEGWTSARIFTVAEFVAMMKPFDER